MTRIRLFLFIFAMLAPSLAAAQQSMKFEEAAAMLAASCGKDIDDNCRGVNLDATRLKECLGRNQDVVSAKCKADFPVALGAIQQRITARTSLVKLCNWELKHLCGEVREDPVKGLQCLLDFDQEGDPELQQGDQRSGVSLMPGGNKLRGIALLLGALALFALPVAAGRAQTATSSGDIIEKLAVEAESDIDLAALKQQAADRIKARADAQPQKRPPIAPQLTKLPQIRFDVVFDQDSSLIRPASYQTIGSIADALSDPKLRPYRYLIVDHVESAGRRDHNLILSQRRAESIRDVLVNTFKVSPKRLQALGLGEEQLQDVNRPASPANARVQIIAIGKFETADPATPAAAAPKGPAAAKKKKR